MGASFSSDFTEKSTSSYALSVAAVAVVALPLAVCSYELAKSYVSTRRKNLPPGPRPVPVLGNLLDVGDEAHKGFQRLAEEYGPVIMLQMGIRSAVVLSSPEAVKEAMIARRTATAGRPQLPTIKAFGGNGKNIAFAEGADWRRRRKAISMKLLHKSKFMEKMPLMKECLLDVVAALQQRCKGASALLDVKPYTRAFSMNIIYELMFNQRLPVGQEGGDAELIKLDEAFKVVFQELGSANLEDYLPLLHLMPTRHMRATWQSAKIRNQIILKAIKQSQQKVLQAEGNITPANILDELVLSHDDHHLSDDELVNVLSDIVGAATDTTSVTLEWLLVLMADNPAAQKAVHAELDDVFGADGVPDDIDRSRLPLLTATIMEAMRIRPVAPTLVPHRTTEATEIGGYDIPEDTLIIVNNYSLALDSKLWDRPEEFRPRRFLEEESCLKLQGAESRPNVDSYKFIPFGVGVRYCPGQEMAQAELFLAASHLLHNFEWQPDPSYQVNLDGDLGLTLEPKHQKLTCLSRRRSAESASA